MRYRNELIFKHTQEKSWKIPPSIASKLGASLQGKT